MRDTEATLAAAVLAEALALRLRPLLPRRVRLRVECVEDELWVELSALGRRSGSGRKVPRGRLAAGELLAFSLEVLAQVQEFMRTRHRPAWPRRRYRRIGGAGPAAAIENGMLVLSYGPPQQPVLRVAPVALLELDPSPAAIEALRAGQLEELLSLEDPLDDEPVGEPQRIAGGSAPGFAFGWCGGQPEPLAPRLGVFRRQRRADDEVPPESPPFWDEDWKRFAKRMPDPRWLPRPPSPGHVLSGQSRLLLRAASGRTIYAAPTEHGWVAYHVSGDGGTTVPYLFDGGFTWALSYRADHERAMIVLLHGLLADDVEAVDVLLADGTPCPAEVGENGMLWERRGFDPQLIRELLLSYPDGTTRRVKLH